MAGLASLTETLDRLFPGRALPSPRQAAHDLIINASTRLGPAMRADMQEVARKLMTAPEPCAVILGEINCLTRELSGLALLPDEYSFSDAREAISILLRAQSVVARARE